MFELSQFYDYCRKTGVDVIPFAGIPQPGATVRDGSHYAVFLDFSQIKSTRLLRGICCHEMAHVATGALHKVCSPYETVERSEYRANRWCAEHYLTEADFRKAFSCGCTALWELSEYFDLPENEVQQALTYWTDRRGVDFQKEKGRSRD